jgi:anaerobic C4-dicarboxylate transporter
VTAPPAELKQGAKTSAFIFFGGVALVVLAGILPVLRTVPGKAVEPVVWECPLPSPS